MRRSLVQFVGLALLAVNVLSLLFAISRIEPSRSSSSHEYSIASNMAAESNQTSPQPHDSRTHHRQTPGQVQQQEEQDQEQDSAASSRGSNVHNSDKSDITLAAAASASATGKRPRARHSWKSCSLFLNMKMAPLVGPHAP